MMFKKFLGLAQKVLCLGLCASLLSTSSFCGVTHASDEAWLAPNATDRVGIWKESGETVVHVDPNNRNKPYSSIRVTGDNSHVRGVDVREYGAEGILYVTKGCQIVATKTGTTDTTGPRGVYLDGDTSTQGSIKFTNDISVSSLDNSGLSGAKGISLQNIIMNMDGHNLTVSEVKGSKNGSAVGIDLFVSPTSSVDCSLTTNGGNIEVKNVSANGMGDATSSDMAVGVSLDKGITSAVKY